MLSWVKVRWYHSVLFLHHYTVVQNLVQWVAPVILPVIILHRTALLSHLMHSEHEVK